MRHRELRIDCDGVLEVRNRCRRTMREQSDLRRTIRLQGFQRRRGCLLQRCRVLLDAGQRLTEPLSHLNRNPTQRLQNSFLPFCLCLLFRHDVSRSAVSGAQPQNVLAAEHCDGAFQNRGTTGSLTDLAGDLRSKPRLGRPVHETEYLLRSLVRDETEERRLFQLHRQSLAERLVKYRIACLVLKLSQDHRILRGEFCWPAKSKVCRRAHHQNRGSDGGGARPAPRQSHRGEFPLQLRS